MIVSYLWLKEWVDHNLTPEELADTLTSLGLEANIVADGRGKFTEFIVGEVESVKPHPNADKLKLTTVNVGGDTPLSIVCGAPNVSKGQTAAVAMVGAKLPDGTVIEKRKIRGEPSEGMILSEKELGISGESSGILLLEPPATAGQKLADCLELEDVLLEIDLTPNRGDCLGLIGIAREVAAFTGGKIKLPGIAGSGGGIENLKVRIENGKDCPRYTAREISGVKVAPSPVKIRRRLSAVGIRPVNNVVDVTNYVMIETGHPLHAFDKRTLEGKKIVVRNAAADEKIKTLDGRIHKLSPEMLVIADGNKAVAIAGVMGGLSSEIQSDTSEIILEAAWFNPVSVRRTAKKLGISTDSSYRFERGVNCETVDFASRRAAKLITEMAGGKLKGFTDEYPVKLEYPQINLRTKKVNDVLGLKLDDGVIEKTLNGFGFNFKKEHAGSYIVYCPSHRHDVTQEVDLIEEVARLVGYHTIPATVARLSQHEVTKETDYRKRSQLSNLWTAAGLTETVNYSFINPVWRERLKLDAKDAIKLKNPISAEWSELRTSLLPGLIQTTAANLRHGAESVSIFETGTVYKSAGNGISEEFCSAGLMTGGMEQLFNVKMPRDFHRLKGIISKVFKALTGLEPDFTRPAKRVPYMYPHRQVEIRLAGKPVGICGQLHKLVTEAFEIDDDLLCFEISVDRLLKSGTGNVTAGPLPKFPGIKRDLAIIVDEDVEAGGVARTICGTDAKRIRSCRLFDLYRGKQVPDGKKSLAFNLFIRDDEKTLTDETGDEIFARILERVEKIHKGRLR